MLKATATASVPLDSLSQRMPAGNFLVSAGFSYFIFFMFSYWDIPKEFLFYFKEEILSVFVYSFLSRSMARMNPML